jgi:hypothetical protein
MWNMKCFVIPVITGATGIVTKGLKKSGNNTRKAFNGFFKKKAILGTSHILRKVKESETLSLTGGVHRWFKRKGTRRRRNNLLLLLPIQG